MPDRYATDAFDNSDSEIARAYPPLPSWLASRLLREDEEVAWVVGPRFNPSWERYATHPLLFLAALAAGAVAWAVGGLIAEGEREVVFGVGCAAGAIVLASIFVLGISSGYFTRLVVTDRRLLIVQGRELCRTWDINRLPRSLLRYRRLADGEDEAPAIDLDALKTILGSSSDKFAEAGKILALGKRLDQIKTREDGRPRNG